MNKVTVLFVGNFTPNSDFESITLQREERILGEALSYVKSTEVALSYQSRLFAEEVHGHVKVAKQYVDLWGKI